MEAEAIRAGREESQYVQSGQDDEQITPGSEARRDGGESGAGGGEAGYKYENCVQGRESTGVTAAKQDNVLSKDEIIGARAAGGIRLMLPSQPIVCARAAGLSQLPGSLCCRVYPLALRSPEAIVLVAARKKQSR